VSSLCDLGFFTTWRLGSKSEHQKSDRARSEVTGLDLSSSTHKGGYHVCSGPKKTKIDHLWMEEWQMSKINIYRTRNY
jgi:hypothetical protein